MRAHARLRHDRGPQKRDPRRRSTCILSDGRKMAIALKGDIEVARRAP
jgi:hypothetical protein